MPEAALVDEAARHAVVEDLDATLFVEAGAGTGKTTALVARVLALVRNGRAELGRVAAITFTEAAAAELRQRVHEALEAAAATPGGEWALSALASLDDAAMTTIHGFAQRLLGEYPLEAGLPLRIRVLDEIEAELEFERRFAALLDRLLDDDDAFLVGAALAVGISLFDVERLAASIDEAWDRGAAPAGERRGGAALAGEVDAACAALVDEMGQLASLVGAVAPSDKLGELLTQIVDEATRWPDDGDWVERLEWLCSLSSWSAHNKGRKAEWGEGIAEVRQRVAELNERRATSSDELRGAVLVALAARLGEEARQAAFERRRRGELRFHDLLVWARRLLADNAAVRGELRERYSHVLVDEFQDTDPLQLEIVRLLGAGDDGAPVPGKLFFVGDPRQSIYRFRGADPGLYAAALDRLVPSGPTRLVTNFRSVPDVLAFVNAVFAPLFSGNGEGGGQAAFTPLAPARPTGGNDPAVIVLGGPAPAGERVAERRGREAEEIAAVIERALEEGWTVDAGAGARPARAGDIAILVPRRTGLASLEAALDERELAYRVQSSTLVYRSTEVRELLACVRAVAEPAEESALIAALRSPMFGCGDDDLAAYRRAGGAWRLETRPPADVAGGPVAIGLSWMAALHDRRHVLGVLGVVEEIIAERRVLQLAAGTRRGREALRRILFVLDQARAFVDAGGATLTELLTWMERQAERDVGTAEEPAESEDDDAVRILTIHGAKGLEFPITVLAELGGQPCAASGPRLAYAGDGRLELRLREGLATPGYAALAARETRLDGEERLRLAYVAATRARDHLVVSLHHAPATTAAGASLAELLHGQLERAAGCWRHLEGPARLPGVAVRSRPAAQPVSFEALDYERWRVERDALAAGSAGRGAVAATELVVDETTGVPAWAERARQRRRQAAALGRAVHAVLARIDLVTGAGLEELATGEALAEGCAERTAEIAALVRAALATDIVRRAAASSQTTRRELPLAVPIGETVLDGVIDLLVDDGELVVVDYKSDVLRSQGEVAAAAAHYRPQVAAYALGLAEVLGRSVDRAMLVFLAAPGGARQVEVDGLAEALCEARAALAGALAEQAAPGEAEAFTLFSKESVGNV